MRSSFFLFYVVHFRNFLDILKSVHIYHRSFTIKYQNTNLLRQFSVREAKVNFSKSARFRGRNVSRIFTTGCCSLVKFLSRLFANLLVGIRRSIRIVVAVSETHFTRTLLQKLIIVGSLG
jgi:hypothetical protein